MLGFYYGTSIPNQDALEGIYFIKDENNKSYSIYIKIKDEDAVKYGDTSDDKSDKDHYHKFYNNIYECYQFFLHYHHH